MFDAYWPMMAFASPRARLRMRGFSSLLAAVCIVHMSIGSAQESDSTGSGFSTNVAALNWIDHELNGSILDVNPGLGASGRGLTYGIDAGVAESDNINLSPNTDKLAQTVAVTDLDFAYEQLSRQLEADLKGDFTFQDYLQHAYGSLFIGRFDGLAAYTLIPERFWWTAEEDFGQAQLDPFTPLTPLNRQNINYVTTGPRWLIDLSRVTFLKLEGTASRTTYAVSPFDSTQLFGSATLGRRISAQSTLAIVGSVDSSRFDNTSVNANFDRYNAYIHYELLGVRGGISADLGDTSVVSGSSTRSDPLATLRLVRQLSPSATLAIKAGQELTDASAAFRGIQSGAVGAIVTAPVVQTTSNYVTRYGAGEFRYERPLTTITASVRVEYDSYPQDRQLDLRQDSFELRVARRFSPSLSGEVHGAILNVDYSNEDFSSTDHNFGASLSAELGRRLELRCQYDRVQHEVVGNLSSYVENQGRVTIGYHSR
jgi:hypothetical protein